jgi:hypothetical protein
LADFYHRPGFRALPSGARIKDVCGVSGVSGVSGKGGGCSRHRCVLKGLARRATVITSALIKSAKAVATSA